MIDVDVVMIDADVTMIDVVWSMRCNNECGDDRRCDNLMPMSRDRCMNSKLVSIQFSVIRAWIINVTSAL